MSRNTYDMKSMSLIFDRFSGDAQFTPFTRSTLFSQYRSVVLPLVNAWSTKKRIAVLCKYSGRLLPPLGIDTQLWVRPPSRLQIAVGSEPLVDCENTRSHGTLPVKALFEIRRQSAVPDGPQV